MVENTFEKFREGLVECKQRVSVLEEKVKNLTAVDRNMDVLKDQINREAYLKAEIRKRLDGVRSAVSGDVTRFLGMFDKNKYQLWNSSEYDNIKTALNRLDPQQHPVSEMTQEQLRDNLTAIKGAAQAYLDAKRAQRGRLNSRQRIYRMKYAESIIAFADKQLEALNMNGLKQHMIATAKDFDTIVADALSRADLDQKISGITAQQAQKLNSFSAFKEEMTGMLGKEVKGSEPERRSCGQGSLQGN